VPPTVRLTAQRFGPERANLVFGWIFAGHQLGAGVAAFGAGLSNPDDPDVSLRDFTGRTRLWIEVGQPEDKPITKAKVRV